MDNIDTSRGGSDIDLSKVRHLIDKDKLLKFANQMLKEAEYLKDELDTSDYRLGVWVGVDRIVKLIERQ